MAYVTIPCLAIYTVYSLIYETHRGWYSFVISTLTSFVYMFGFVSTVTRTEICRMLTGFYHRPNLSHNLSSTTSSRYVTCAIQMFYSTLNESFVMGFIERSAHADESHDL